MENVIPGPYPNPGGFVDWTELLDDISILIQRAVGWLCLSAQRRGTHTLECEGDKGVCVCMPIMGECVF